MVALWIRLRKPYDKMEVDQGVAVDQEVEADQEVALVQVSLLLRLWSRFGSQLRAVASIVKNPFTDSHAVSTLTDITVNDLERVEMTTYQAGDTSGQ
jgi:hypothetical protein